MNRTPLLSPLTGGKFPHANVVFVQCKSSTGGSRHTANENPSALTGTSPVRGGICEVQS
jgi:hypothetical protein